MDKKDNALKILTKINGQERAKTELEEIIYSVQHLALGKFSELFKGKMFKIIIIGKIDL